MSDKPVQMPTDIHSVVDAFADSLFGEGEQKARCVGRLHKIIDHCVAEAVKRVREELAADNFKAFQDMVPEPTLVRGVTAIATPAIDRSAASAAMLESAWGIIANVSKGDWSKQPDEWQEAAARWRNEWLALPAPASAPSGGDAAGPHVDDVLSLVKRARMVHGDCARANACTACMANQELTDILADWRGHKVGLAALGDAGKAREEGK